MSKTLGREQPLIEALSEAIDGSERACPAEHAAFACRTALAGGPGKDTLVSKDSVLRLGKRVEDERRMELDDIPSVGARDILRGTIEAEILEGVGDGRRTRRVSPGSSVPAEAAGPKSLQRRGRLALAMGISATTKLA